MWVHFLRNYIVFCNWKINQNTKIIIFFQNFTQHLSIVTERGDEDQPRNISKKIILSLDLFAENPLLVEVTSILLRMNFKFKMTCGRLASCHFRFEIHSNNRGYLHQKWIFCKKIAIKTPEWRHLFHLWFSDDFRAIRSQPSITCSKLTIKILKQGVEYVQSYVFIVNFKHISHLVLVFILLTLGR